MTETLEKCQLFDDITRIDVGDIYQMMVVYQGRIRILLGTSNDLETKINAAKKIVEQELGEDEKGELDVSLTRDLKKAYYNADSVASSQSSQRNLPKVPNLLKHLPPKQAEILLRRNLLLKRKRSKKCRNPRFYGERNSKILKIAGFVSRF